MDYFFEHSFEQINFKEQKLVFGEYEQCVFVNCDFTQFNLNAYKFIDCKFIDCNLSMVSLVDTVMNKVHFLSCKMLGIHWFQCDKFMFLVKYESCILSNSSYYNFNIKKTNFESCDLKEVDFTESNLSECKFLNCNLDNAIFDKTNLTKANLSTAFNLNINPISNQLKGALFGQQNIEGLLQVFQIKVV